MKKPRDRMPRRFQRLDRYRQRDPEWISNEIHWILTATQQEWKRGNR